MNLKYRWRKNAKAIGKTPLPMNAKMLLHFNGSLDDEMKLQTSSINGTATYVNGKYYRAISFDGASCVEIPYNSNLVFGKNDFTIAGWFKWDGRYSDVSHPRLFSQQYYYNDSANMAGFCVNINNSGQIVWNVNKTYNSHVVLSDNTLVKMPIRKWTHIAMVRYGTKLSLYMDGKEIASATFAATSSVYQHKNSVFRIGSGAGYKDTTKDEASHYFVGDAEEFIVTIGEALWTEDFTPPKKAYTNHIVLGSLPKGSVVWYDDPETDTTSFFDVVDSQYDKKETCVTLFGYDGVPCAGVSDDGGKTYTVDDEVTQNIIKQVVNICYGETFLSLLREYNFPLPTVADGKETTETMTDIVAVPVDETFGIRYSEYGSTTAVAYLLRGQYITGWGGSIEEGFPIISGKAVDANGNAYVVDYFTDDNKPMVFPVIFAPQSLKVQKIEDGMYSGTYQIIMSNTTSALDSAILDSMILE